MRLVIHANATAGVGAGHVMRCATLAEAWIHGGFGDVHLSGVITLPFAERRLRAVGVEMAQAVVPSANDVFVVDSYDDAARNALRDAAAALAVLVDDVGGHVPSGTDVIWNPNPYDSTPLYVGFGGRVLAGPRCVPIRRDLPAWTSTACSGTAVALGGSVLRDPIQQTLIEALSDERVGPVTGVGVWIPSKWTAADVNAPWRDLTTACRAVVGAGTSAWEAAAMGIPSVVVCIAENQRLSFEWIRASGAAVVDLSEPDTIVGADALRRAIGEARPLIRLESGADHVASMLHTFAKRVRPA